MVRVFRPYCSEGFPQRTGWCPASLRALLVVEQSSCPGEVGVEGGEEATGWLGDAIDPSPASWEGNK